MDKTIGDYTKKECEYSASHLLRYLGGGRYLTLQYKMTNFKAVNYQRGGFECDLVIMGRKVSFRCVISFLDLVDMEIYTKVEGKEEHLWGNAMVNIWDSQYCFLEGVFRVQNLNF